MIIGDLRVQSEVKPAVRYDRHQEILNGRVLVQMHIRIEPLLDKILWSRRLQIDNRLALYLHRIKVYIFCILYIEFAITQKYCEVIYIGIRKFFERDPNYIMKGTNATTCYIHSIQLEKQICQFYIELFNIKPAKDEELYE